jgi:hypothetical protein
MKTSVVWDITPCNLLKVSQVLLATYFMLVSWLAYSLTLKMEGTCSSKMLVNFQQTTWCYIPEGISVYIFMKIDGPV